MAVLQHIKFLYNFYYFVNVAFDWWSNPLNFDRETMTGIGGERADDTLCSVKIFKVPMGL